MNVTTLDYAFGLLLERFGISPSDDVSLDDDPQKLLTITDYYTDIMVIAMGKPGTWPDTNDALVSFQINSEGNQYPDIQEAYYLVADYEKQLVINPKNGKKVHIIADPIGWISYGPATDPVGNPTDKPEYKYTWVKYDNIWDVARRTGQDVKELLEHNDITNPDNIHPGTVLHLPHPYVRKTDDKEITYELHTPSKQMHITTQDGAYKWSFGNAKKLTDIVKSGPTWAWNAPVEVVATAHVPLEEGTAHYYMTATDLGNFRETERVNYNIGFNHTHLAEGEPVEVPVIPPAPIVTPEVVIEDVKRYESERYPNKWRETIRPLREPQLYFIKKGGVVYDLAQHKSGEYLEEGEKIKAYRKCIKYDPRQDKDVEYRIPDGGDKEIIFGIPLDWLEPINENADIDEIADITPVEKAADHRSGSKRPFSPPEKVWDVVAHNVGRGIKFTDSVKKKLTRKV